MKRSPIVGSRELKTRLGTYLNRVRRGETILVTDRNEPVAELRPLPGAGDPSLAGLRRAGAGGAPPRPGAAPPRPGSPACPPRAGGRPRRVPGARGPPV